MDDQNVFIDEEGAESEADLGKQDSSVYSKAVIWGTDWTAETIISQLRKKNIDLNPDFQRRDAWDIDKKSKFIESLILGLPVPPIILAEKKEKKNSYIVIDGKQRLLSIMQFCKSDGDIEYESLFLNNLEILHDLNGLNYEILLQNKDSENYVTNFDNQAIRAVVIKNWPNEKFLYTVFLRLNTGSLKLSPQELRQALHPGEFLNYINKYVETKNPIRDILNLSRPDSRMRDIELIIRFFSFKNYLNEYKESLKDFLDVCCKKLNDGWKENQDNYQEQQKSLEAAISFTTEIFGKRNRFSKYLDNKYTNIFNRTIYDIMAYYFSDVKHLNVLRNKKQDVKLAFEDMSKDKEFIWATAGSTKDMEKTKKRYELWGQRIKQLCEQE
jgi:uncharacterized protein with ParB-like and HNH nuclease domain